MQSESRVAKASKNIPPYKGTTMDKEIVCKHQRSRNEHLSRISPFLQLGEGIWWKNIEGGYQFYDGETDGKQLPDRPQLMNFRSATLQDVYIRQSLCWDSALQVKVVLPTPQLYTNSSTTLDHTDNTEQFQTCEARTTTIRPARNNPIGSA